MVKGWSVGGGKVLQLFVDLTIAADNAMFGQTDLKLVALMQVMVQDI